MPTSYTTLDAVHSRFQRDGHHHVSCSQGFCKCRNMCSWCSWCSSRVFRAVSADVVTCVCVCASAGQCPVFVGPLHNISARLSDTDTDTDGDTGHGTWDTDTDTDMDRGRERDKTCGRRLRWRKSSPPTTYVWSTKVNALFTLLNRVRLSLKCVFSHGFNPTSECAENAAALGSRRCLDTNRLVATDNACETHEALLNNHRRELANWGAILTLL